MRNIGVYNMVSLDGYFVDVNGDMSVFHKQDPEWNAYVAQNARGGDVEFLYGRKTYELMAKFWPTPQAAQIMPDVATSAQSVIEAQVTNGVAVRMALLYRLAEA